MEGKNRSESVICFLDWYTIMRALKPQNESTFNLWEIFSLKPSIGFGVNGKSFRDFFFHFNHTEPYAFAIECIHYWDTWLFNRYRRRWFLRKYFPYPDIAEILITIPILVVVVVVVCRSILSNKIDKDGEEWKNVCKAKKWWKIRDRRESMDVRRKKWKIKRLSQSHSCHRTMGPHKVFQ